MAKKQAKNQTDIARANAEFFIVAYQKLSEGMAEIKHRLAGLTAGEIKRISQKKVKVGDKYNDK